MEIYITEKRKKEEKRNHVSHQQVLAVCLEEEGCHEGVQLRLLDTVLHSTLAEMKLPLTLAWTELGFFDK